MQPGALGRGRRKFQGGQVLSTWLMLVYASSVEVFILLKTKEGILIWRT